MKRGIKALLGMSLTGLVACSMLMPASGLFAEENNSDSGLEGMSYSDQSGLFLSMDENGNVSYVEPDVNDISDELELPEESNKDTTFELKMTHGEESDTIGEFETFEEANAAMTRRSLFRSVGDLDVYAGNQLRASSSYSVVNFNVGYDTTSYTEVGTGTSGYTYGGYAADAAYIGTNSNGTKIKFKLAGVTGWVDKNKVSIVKYSNSLNLSYYAISNGYLYHYISTNLNAGSSSSTQVVGKAPSYLANGTKYYSYDGHYFYKTYATMIEDYKSDTTRYAVNKDQPFYNYYQFLSHRTKTTFTASDFNTRVSKVLSGGTSKMTNTGSAFIDSQNQYSVNASLMFGLAVNESAWGQSKIAKNKNNLFGHGAVDSDPYKAAFVYGSILEGINYHAKVFVDKGYIDPADWRYFGPHLGDKASGMNVKYASDPYWGEKAAAQSYYLEMQSGKNDSSKYTIGIYTGDDVVNIRKDASTSSSSLYTTGNGSTYVNQFPFTIIGEVNGQNVGGTTKWYKIQADGSLNANRTNVDIKRDYDFSHDYGYVSASLLTLMTKGSDSSTNNGGTSGGGSSNSVKPEAVMKSAGYRVNGSYVGKFTVGTDVSKIINNIKSVTGVKSVKVTNKSGKSITSGKASTGMKISVATESSSKDFNIVILGDVNGDGSIGATDLYYLQRHILKTEKLTGAYLEAAKISNDSAGATSLFNIKQDILNVEKIKQ